MDDSRIMYSTVQTKIYCTQIIGSDTLPLPHVDVDVDVIGLFVV